MKVRHVVRAMVVGLLTMGALSLPGCSGSPGDTGPTEEPNLGPGGPPGAAAGAAKPAAGKAFAKPENFTKSGAGKAASKAAQVK